MWNFGRQTDNDSNPNKRGNLSGTNWGNKSRWIERGLLSCGLGLLAVFGVVCLESYIASRAALKSFAAHEALSPLIQNSGVSAGPPEAETTHAVESSVLVQREGIAKRSCGAIAV